MHEPPRGQPTASEAERDDLEVTDLRGARRAGSRALWSAATLNGAARSSRQRLVRLGGVLAALALVVTVLLYGIHSGALAGGDTARIASTPLLPTPVVRYPDLHGLQCLRDDAWSPDGRFFAYAGNSSQGCGYGQYFPNVINIYRASDGTLVRRLAPDPKIFAALSQSVPPSVPPDVTPAPSVIFMMYDSLLWSRDGQRFAVVFVESAGTTTMQGVAVVRASDGTVERVVAAPFVAPNGYTVWDLSTGTAATYTAPPGTNGAVTIVPAPAYTWSAAGQLLPTGSFPQPAAPAPAIIGPIGDPNGDASFSIWQAGTIQFGLPTGSAGSGPVGVYVFIAQVAAWSPNGRFVAAYMVVGGRAQPSGAPAPDAAAVAQLKLANLPLLPLRDNGLDQALRRVQTPMDRANPSLQSSAWVAYRPDGRALALLDDQGNFAVYAASSGAALYPFRQLDLLANTHNGNAGAMRWSPDGTALLLPDGSVLHVGRLGG